MHNAPSVQYPAGRSVWGWRFQGLLIGLWVVVQATWLHSLDWTWPPGAWWWSLVLGLVACGHALWRSQHEPQGLLQWDATVLPQGQWRWTSAAFRNGTPLERVEWVLDLKTAALLRLQTAAGWPLWVWVERQQQPADWDALRRALYASRSMLEAAPPRHRP